MTTMNIPLYKKTSFGLSVIFAAVGLLFLLLPDGVIQFMNSLARQLKATEAPAGGQSVFLVLAGAYMYIVTLLAWLMFRHSYNLTYPLLLTQAKLISSILSFGFYFLKAPYFIYLANGIVDGLIGIIVLLFFIGLKKSIVALKA